LVTKASGPEGFEVQLESVRASRKILPQRRNGAASFVAPLRRRVRKTSSIHVGYRSSLNGISSSTSHNNRKRRGSEKRHDRHGQRRGRERHREDRDRQRIDTRNRNQRREDNC